MDQARGKRFVVRDILRLDRGQLRLLYRKMRQVWKRPRVQCSQQTSHTIHPHPRMVQIQPRQTLQRFTPQQRAQGLNPKRTTPQLQLVQSSQVRRTTQLLQMGIGRLRNHQHFCKLRPEARYPTNQMRHPPLRHHPQRPRPLRKQIRIPLHSKQRLKLALFNCAITSHNVCQCFCVGSDAINAIPTRTMSPSASARRLTSFKPRCRPSSRINFICFAVTRSSSDNSIC